jgi:hypothetical protein
MYSNDKFYVSHFTSKDNLKYILESMSLQPLSLQEKIFKHKNPKGEWNPTYYYESSETEGDPEKYKRSIFYSILFPDNDGIPIFNPPFIGHDVYFIFSSKIISDNANMVGKHNIQEGPIFCKNWNFGKIIPKWCTSYDSSKSLDENLNSWRALLSKSIQTYHEGNKEYNSDLMPMESGALGTELLIEGEMPIEADLKYIYVPRGNLEMNIIEKLGKINPIYEKLSEKMIEQTNFDEKNIEDLMKSYDYLPWTTTNPFK